MKSSRPSQPKYFSPRGLEPTSEQLSIQTAAKQIILIDANAGAAKTTTLALRIAESLARGTSPESILVLVFTQAAREVMRERLLEIGTAFSLVKRLRIDTFEGFSQGVLLQLEGVEIPCLEHEEDLRAHVVEAIGYVSEKHSGTFALEIATHNHAIDEFLKIQLRMKARMDVYRFDFEGLDAEEIATLLGVTLTHYLLFCEYERIRGGNSDDEVRFRGVFDATYDLTRMLAASPERISAIPNYRMIIADELHDLSEATFRLLSMLVQRNRTLFCGAGDKDQVIYSWSGADHQFLRHRFEETFPKLDRYLLTRTFRHGPQLSESMAAFKSKKNESGLPIETAIHVLHYESGYAGTCAEQAVAALRKWQEDGGSIGATAILLRDSHQSIYLENALIKAQIGYKPVGMKGYLQRREVMMLRGMMAIALKNLDSVKVLEHRKMIVEALSIFAELPLTQKELQRAQDTISENPGFLEWFFTEQIQNRASENRRRTILSAVDFLKSVNADDLAGDVLQRLFEIMKLDDVAKRIYVDPREAEDVAKSISGFMAVCRDSGMNLGRFSNWIGELEERTTHAKPRNSLTLACLDSVKGREYDHVIIPFLEEGEFPSATGELWEEENRFYVAATRTIRRLTLLAPIDANLRSRFIARMQIEKSVKDGNKLLEKMQSGNTVAAMDRIYLVVPYGEKAIAKSLGASWDKTHKKWYITSEMDTGKFKLWLPK